MTYGYFESQAREFVITRPDTPTPWINYLGDHTYGGIISNTAGGYSFDGDPKYRRLLRYRYNSLPADRPGRYLYILGEDGQAWSPTWAPVCVPLDRYECRHGLGYTVIEGCKNGVSAQGTFFVPPGARLEVWRWRISHSRPEPVRLKTFCYAEFCPYDADNDLTNLDWTQQIANAWAKGNVIYYTTHMRTTGCTFLCTSAGPSGFDCDRESFVGRYRSEQNPIAVERGHSLGSLAHRGNGIGSFFHEWVIPPGESVEVVFVMGIADGEEDVPNRIAPYCDPAALEAAFGELKAQWQDRLGALTVQTPDPILSEMVNTWNPYQCMTTFNWARFVSLYECGIRRGIGFRDSCQDTLGVAHVAQSAVRERLLRLLGNQFSRGDAYHQYFPFTGEGDKTGYSDDHLWAVLATTHYIKETGDVDVLAEPVKYADGGGSDPIYAHLARAVEYSLNTLGPHGVPRLGFADWNDALNLSNEPAPAESVLVGFLLCKALREMVQLAEHVGRQPDVERFEHEHRTMADLLNQVAWDGDWYLRGWKGDGSPVGSRENDAGRIFLNPQSWAVISSAAPLPRSQACMKSALELLDTPVGIMLMGPPYPKYDASIGGCTTYPPGAKENGGIFVHTNPWAIMAFAMLGDGETAFRLYRQIAPPGHLENPDHFQVEPYVFCQNILGLPHPLYGLGRNSWLTGTASWAYVAATQYILGVRPDYGGLVISPCIPPQWLGFKIRRRFREAWYDIEVRNPDRVSSGVREIRVDGRPVERLPVLRKGDECRATVVLGQHK